MTEIKNFLSRGSWSKFPRAKVKEMRRKVIGTKVVFKKKDEIDMTPLQFEQVFKILDKDHSGYMEPCEFLALV